LIRNRLLLGPTLPVGRFKALRQPSGHGPVQETTRQLDALTPVRGFPDSNINLRLTSANRFT